MKNILIQKYIDIEILCRLFVALLSQNSKLLSHLLVVCLVYTSIHAVYYYTTKPRFQKNTRNQYPHVYRSATTASVAVHAPVLTASHLSAGTDVHRCVYIIYTFTASYGHLDWHTFCHSHAYCSESLLV